ncbi:MAG: uroporphyrinogen decarboxylase family protein [Planctomycetota bacterium]|jgi:uroporphyrinogen-III decarboxylase
MDFKQRFLTAMNHEEPDRVPVMGLIMDPATVNEILHKKAVDFPGMLQKPLLRGAIRRLLNTHWFWNRMYYDNFSGALEGAIELGFDANWTIYAHMQLEPDPESSLGTVWHDVFGRVWEMGSDHKNNMSVNYTRALCPTEADWEAWVERKAPLFDRVITNATRFHERLVREYGDRILPIGYAAPGIFENSWQAIGFVNFTKLVYEKREFIRRVVEFQTDFYLRYLEGVMKSGVEVVLGGDDLGHKTGPLLRPELIDELYGESYRRVTDLVHRNGKKFVFHSCGRIYKFLDHFVDWGFDGIITMEPTAGMELARVREQVGHKLVLIGNLDVSRLLVRGTREEVDEAVKQAIRDAARGGGYILSAAHSHPFVDPERLRWMVEAAHQHGRYPIAV